MQKRAAKFLCVVLLGAFLACFAFSLLNLKTLLSKPFSRVTYIDTPSSAKYERGGNIYVIDKAAYRLVCMNPASEIQYIIEIDRKKENLKIYDSAVDISGNLYLYLMESETGAYFNKRDEIRQYDSTGKFVRVLYSVEYDSQSDYRPHAFPEFGSFVCFDRYLTFSRTMENNVELFMFDVLTGEMQKKIMSDSAIQNHVIQNYSVAKLMLKDFNNFVYVTRDGNVFEVKDAEKPVLRTSFDYSIETGGIVPWHIQYGENEDVLVGDKISARVLRITKNEEIANTVPDELFDTLYEDAGIMTLSNFGAKENKFAGVLGNTVWFFDGEQLNAYKQGLKLPSKMILFNNFVQTMFLLSIILLIFFVLVLVQDVCGGFISLYIKQIFISIPLAAAAALFMYINLNTIFEARLNDEISLRLKTLCSSAAKNVDGGKLKQLRTLKDFNSEAYNTILQSLKDCIGGNQDEWNKTLFSAVYTGGEYRYQMCISNETAGMFTPSVPLASENMQTILSGGITVEISSTAGGIYAYANAPVYDGEGVFVGVVEVGADLASYQLNNLAQKRTMKICIAALFIAFLIGQFLIMFIIKTNLSKLEFAIGLIKQGVFSNRIGYRGKDELGKVNSALNVMSETLQERITYINTKSEAAMRFVPLEIMKYLSLNELTQIKPGDSVQKKMTVLCFNIHAFEINSEMMSTVQNFKFINTVLGISSPIVRKHNGFVDKITGDAVMALFANATDALRAGIEIYRVLVLDKETAPKIGVDGIDIGIGINTGAVMLGILGEESRLSGAVISKNVDFAIRTESLTKQAGAGMLVTRPAMSEIENAGEKASNRFVGMIQVAGTNEMCGVFDILEALPIEQRRLREKTKETFESGVRRFHAKNYAEALEQFQKVFDENPLDSCAKLYIEAAKERIENPDLSSIFVFSK